MHWLHYIAVFIVGYLSIWLGSEHYLRHQTNLESDPFNDRYPKFHKIAFAYSALGWALIIGSLIAILVELNNIYI